MLIYNIIISAYCLILFYTKVNKNNYFVIINIMALNAALVFLFFIDNIYYFFIFYELTMIPSILLIKFSSPNLRSKVVSIYFILWTQFGSFLVFLSILLLFKINYNFYNYTNQSPSIYNTVIFLLFFFGFGIKIPIWPFHFWLTKTHVEVNTAFSVYLSGLLVKIAIFGLYKFTVMFSFSLNSLPIILSLIGIIDVSIKIQNQVDFKKIVAYCTIFEMNIILLNLFFFSNKIVIYVLLFCVMHTSLSGIFFVLSDLIYKRYNTRCTYSIKGSLDYYFVLSVVLFLSVLLFNGIPFSLKFNLEFILFLKLLNFNFLLLLYFMTIQILFIIFFSKVCYGLIFNSNSKLYNISDLSKFELYIILFNFLPLILL